MPVTSAPYRPFRTLKPGAKILLAFSGGVDSTVAAHLCKQAGYEVLAVHMRLLPNSKKNSDAVQKAADSLGVPLHFLDLEQEFREQVMRPCWLESDAGRTPNPCTLCNPAFKFGKLREYALAQGCSAMATGHYAKILETDCGLLIGRGEYRVKDQSYFLFGLSPEQIAFSVFPLGGMTKPEVRAIAAGLGLPNAEAKESQDACFTPETGTLAEMLRNEFEGAAKPGWFIHAETGKILGRHAGIHAYTIGQRKGTGVALGKPAYVQRIDTEKHAVYITGDERTLWVDSLRAARTNWAASPVPADPFRAEVQIRYRGAPCPALVVPEDGGKSFSVRFDSPIRAVTPGQAAVIYLDNAIAGGGFIL